MGAGAGTARGKQARAASPLVGALSSAPPSFLSPALPVRFCLPGQGRPSPQPQSPQPQPPQDPPSLTWRVATVHDRTRDKRPRPLPPQRTTRPVSWALSARTRTRAALKLRAPHARCCLGAARARRRPREPPRGGCAAPLAPAANAAPTFCCTASAVCRRAAARAVRTTRAKAGAADARGPARSLHARVSRRAAVAAARCSVRAVTAASVAAMASRRASTVVAVRASSTSRRFRERAAARSGERTRAPVLPPSPPASARARLRAAAAVSIPASRSAAAAAACNRSFSLSLWLMSAHADAP